MANSILGIRIEKMKEVVRQLSVLLENPEPGLISWIMAVEKYRVRLNSIMDGKEDE